MQVWSQQNQVFKLCGIKRWTLDGLEESSNQSRIAQLQQCLPIDVFLWLFKFLQAICSKLLKDGLVVDLPFEERHTIPMDTNAV